MQETNDIDRMSNNCEPVEDTGVAKIQRLDFKNLVRRLRWTDVRIARDLELLYAQIVSGRRSELGAMCVYAIALTWALRIRQVAQPRLIAAAGFLRSRVSGGLHRADLIPNNIYLTVSSPCHGNTWQ